MEGMEGTFVVDLFHGGAVLLREIEIRISYIRPITQ